MGRRKNFDQRPLVDLLMAVQTHKKFHIFAYYYYRLTIAQKVEMCEKVTKIGKT